MTPSLARRCSISRVLAPILYLACAGSILLPSVARSQTRWDANVDRSRDSVFQNSGNSWQNNDWLSNIKSNQPTWNLGLSGDNTEVGVLVRSVVPQGAANKARIEVGDIIINVGGYQVGMVEGRLYDLAEEINHNANENGVVSLVVQDHRTLRIARVRVQLDGQDQALTGNLVYSGRNPIPRDAIVTVQIENVTRPYYRVHHGQTSFRTNGDSTIPFRIDYDPSYINAQDTYVVRAFVTSNGRTVLDTLRPTPVLTQGNPSQVQLRLEPQPTSSLAGNGNGGGVVTAGYPNLNAIDSTITSLYRRYLQRSPQALELAVLRNTPGIEERLRTFPLELMAGQEYFDAAGNNNQVWLEKVFEEIVRKRPSPSEFSQWMDRYASLRYSRTELLRQLYSQVQR